MKVLVLLILFLTGCTSVQVVEYSNNNPKTITFRYVNNRMNDANKNEEIAVSNAKDFCGGEVKLANVSYNSQQTGYAYTSYGMAATGTNYVYLTYQCL